MSVQKRQAHLLNEAKALAFFFGVSSDRLVAAFTVFDDLYASSSHVDAEAFTSAQDAIDAEIEDLCLARKISQEKLEDLMSNNFAFKSVVIE